MTSEFLALFAGAVLSLAFSYVPRLRDWWAAQAPEVKRLLMAGLLFVVAAAVFGLACAGWLAALLPGVTVSCTQAGLLELVKIYILALVANQGAYSLSPQVAKKPYNGVVTWGGLPGK